MSMHTSFRGEYKFVASRNGKVVRETDWFSNHITNAGLDRIGQQDTGGNLFGSCFVGTGNTPPTDTDSSLQALVAQTSTTSASETDAVGPAPTYERRMTRRFSFPAATSNQNYAEVGVGWATNGLWSRALIVDAGGVPTTFSILVGEQLEVIYRLYIYLPQTDSVSTVTISGTTYTVTARLAGRDSAYTTSRIYNNVRWDNDSTTFNAYTGDIGAVSGFPSGTNLGTGSKTLAAYVSGTYRRDVTMNYSTAQGNGTIKALRCSVGNFATFFETQIGFSPGIPKDSTKTLSLTVRYSWGRYVP